MGSEADPRLWLELGELRLAASGLQRSCVSWSPDAVAVESGEQEEPRYFFYADGNCQASLIRGSRERGGSRLKRAMGGGFLFFASLLSCGGGGKRRGP